MIDFFHGKLSAVVDYKYDERNDLLLQSKLENGKLELILTVWMI
ncbi:hypothetical protein [Psychroserpens sp. SPM9]|nr:hypothetical protein [Psychroserpens sp. SPM9]MDG5492375.1 hypothetical protein [Psychroserpens sp. SPM9]